VPAPHFLTISQLPAAIVTNLQCQDVHPLEEADGYESLLDSTLSCTIDEIAAKVGKSKAYVYQRLSLTRLAPRSARW
jgi:ParB family transcriptional regulator, chromosome partitioning protein